MKRNFLKENANHSPSVGHNLRTRRIIIPQTSNRQYISTSTSNEIISQETNNIQIENNSFKTFPDSHWIEPSLDSDSSKLDLESFDQFDDPFGTNSSTIIQSTIIDTSVNTSASTSINNKSSSSNTDALVSQLNNLAIDNTLNVWILTTTNKNGHNKVGYKLSSLGYSYTVDKPKSELIPTASKIYWKCERLSCGAKTCRGRAQSAGLQPPLVVTHGHDHLPQPERVEVLRVCEKIKQAAGASNDPPRSKIREETLNLKESCMAEMTRRDALRQMINRHRNAKLGHHFTAKCLSQIEIPESLHNTFRDELFNWDDSGNDDKNRVILFTTKENLNLLDSYHDWLGDGTFYIAPTFFKQLYTIHIVYRGQSFPLAYGLLPNKKQATYKKFFKMVKHNLKNKVETFNMDFEKAAMNAAEKTFLCEILLCFFYFLQSGFRRVQYHGLVREWHDEQFRMSFKTMQALAYLPVDDVITGFELLSSEAPTKFKPILSWLENNYIGKFKPNSRTSRVVPRYPIKMWNLHERVKKGKNQKP